MSLSNNFPVNSSNLNLSLANAGRLDPRVTFTRASTGTYYDGYSSAKAEENLLLQSQGFTTANWLNEQSTDTANSTTAPDGTLTAETLTDDATLSAHGIYQTGISIAASTTYALSVFVKANTHNYVQLMLRDALVSERYILAVCDLSAGTISQTANGTSGTLTSSSITSVGNSWYRVQIVGSLSAVSSAGSMQFSIRFVNAASGNTFSGFGTSAYSGTSTSFYVWGAQLEQRSSVTSYTETTTAPITNYIPVLQTAAADVPRFDHNPTTRAALGLLVEEQRTNSLTYSEQFDNAFWGATDATITANTIVAPNGTLTGDKLVENTANATHSITQGTVTSGTTYAFTVYAKAAERTQIQLSGMGAEGQGFQTVFNLSTGVVTNAPSGSSMTPVGNGWYRCLLQITATSTAGPIIRLRDASGNNLYTGNGYAGVFIWGAQLEAGAFPTSYIATTTASVTRNADSVNMTGTNFSGWYNATAGTLYADFTPVGAFVAARVAASLNDGSTANFMYIGTRNASATYGANNRVSSGTIVAIGSFGAANTSNQKATFAYSSTGQSVTFNSAAVATATETVPTVTQMNFGGVTSISASTYIRRLTYYPVRNSDAQLQALTG